MIVKAGALLLLLTFSATPAYAVNRQGASDDYNCSHGRPDAAETQAACGRLHATGNEPADDPAASAEPPAQPSMPSEVERGQADRARYEAWFHGLAGEALAGAAYWDANRSVPGHAACNAAEVPSTGAEWTRGCFAARDQLAGADRRRLSSPEYRYGWNHPTADVDTSRAPAPPPEVAPGPTEANSTAASAISDVGAPAAAPSTEPAKSGNGVAGLAAVGLLTIILIVLASGAFYFLPTLIAFGRRKRNAGAILALNLFLGWTLLGWVLAVVWSLSVDPPTPAGARPA